MEKMKMHSMSKIDENIKKIAALFPECITEIVNEDGKLEKVVDIEAFKQLFSRTAVEGNQERYQFTWPDKRKAKALVNQEVTSTLRPCREESVNFDTTENLYIEGDNLEVLKLLQETYLGKIKMIYIDPPYNTGHDFVYEDDFTQNADDYASNSGQYDEQGNRLVENTESNGRFHTDWLNMMYPRLKLARDLLADDGIIFISINDYEIDNLLKISDEIYGRNNRLACFCWRTDGNFDNQARIKTCHEYIALYAKNEFLIPLPNAIDPSIPQSSKIFKEEIRNTIIKNGVKNPISEVLIPVGFPTDFESGEIKYTDVNWPKYTSNISVFMFKTQNEVGATTGWASKAQLLEFIANGFNPVIDSKGQETTFVLTKTGAIEAIKKRSRVSHVISVLTNLGGTQKASAEMGELGAFFDYPKPVALMSYLVSMFTADSDYILDFFSGSATTAHAVIKLNSEDGGKRKFIMVQLPENSAERSEAYKAGYKNICEIGKERIRRAGKQILGELKSKNGDLFTEDVSLDIGFRDLKLDSSNMNDVYYTPDETDQRMLDGFISNIKEDRTAEDLLFQIMLDLGVLLSAKIVEEDIGGKKVFNVDDNYLIACFDENVDENVIMEAAKKKPTYFVMRDSSLANDSVSVNFDQIFARYSPDTVRKVL